MNGATGRPGSPTLRWDPSSGATSYSYCYATAKPCSNWTSTGAATYVGLSGLKANTTYYWHVRAVNGSGTTYSNGSYHGILVVYDRRHWQLQRRIWLCQGVLGLPYTDNLNTAGATTATSDPVFPCTRAVNKNTVWYRYTPSASMPVTISTAGSDYDTVLGVWQGSKGNLVSVACNDDYGSLKQSQVTVFLTGGVAYSIEVASYYAGGGNLVLNATSAALKATYPSQGGYDGWILKSTSTSNLGGTFNATNPTFLLGDDASNRQYRAILSFDTSSLPDTAVILSAVLKIDKKDLTGTNPFTTLGSLWVDMKNGWFGNSAALESLDYSAATLAPRVAAFEFHPLQRVVLRLPQFHRPGQDQ